MKKQYSQRNLVVSTKFTKIPNEVLETLCTIDNNAALRVLLFIIRKTYGFSKKTDCLSLKQIEAGTRLSNRSVCRAIQLLKAKGHITTTKDKDFRKHIPNNITIILGRAGIAIENSKMVDHSNDVDEFLTTDRNDYSDIEDGKTTDKDGSRTTDMAGSSYFTQTTDSAVSRTTDTDGVHKRNLSKEIEDKKKIQIHISPSGTRPSASSPQDCFSCDSASCCGNTPTEGEKKNPEWTPEERQLIKANMGLISRTPYLYGKVRQGRPIEQWELEAAMRIERDGDPYKRRIAQ